jgi:hypothetical protein
MKLSIEFLESAWFNRLRMQDNDYMAFGREEFPKGSGEMWYTSDLS